MVGQSSKRSHTAPRVLPSASDAHCGGVVEGSPQGIIIQQEGRIVFANPAMATLFGYASASEMIGLSTFDELVAEEHRPVLRERTAAVYRGETVKAHPGWRGNRLDGGTIWVSSCALISEWQGQPAVTSFYSDITSSKHADDNLQVSEIRYRRLFEAAQDGVLLIDPATSKIVDANPFMTHLLGYSHGELVGKELFEIGLLKDEIACQKMVQDLTKTHHVRYENLPLESRDGRHQEVEVVANLYDENGKSIIQCNIRDITERKHTEDALRASQERLRHAADAARLTYVDVDFVTGNLLTPPNYAEVMGYGPPANQRIAYSTALRLLFDHIRIEDHPIVNAALVTFRHGKAVGSIDYRILGDDQNERWIESKWTAEYNADGKPLRAFVTNRDITERKLAEERNNLLMAEVNHRAKNLLSVVQALARQTARGGDPLTFVDRLTDRIAGLAASQDLLVENQWHGVQISKLIEAQLVHFRDMIGTRVVLTGPVLWFTPSAAQGIGMALHELATNAAKYGALSNDRGVVRISWQVTASTQSLFSMSWEEEGGPPVSPPTRKGFGQTVIGPMAEASVDGTIEMKYAKKGFSWSLNALVADILEKGRVDGTA